MGTSDCEYDGLEQAARREANAARHDLWIALFMLSVWTLVVAVVAVQLAGAVS